MQNPFSPDFHPVFLVIFTLTFFDKLSTILVVDVLPFDQSFTMFLIIFALLLQSEKDIQKLEKGFLTLWQGSQTQIDSEPHEAQRKVSRAALKN